MEEREEGKRGGEERAGERTLLPIPVRVKNSTLIRERGDEERNVRQNLLCGSGNGGPGRRPLSLSLSFLPLFFSLSSLSAFRQDQKNGTLTERHWDADGSSQMLRDT